MIEKPEEVYLILEQAAQGLASILTAHETGTITIHVGRTDLHVEVERKRRFESVRITKPK